MTTEEQAPRALGCPLEIPQCINVTDVAGRRLTLANCFDAAKAGDLVTLQWLRAQDPPCPWNRWVCMAAVDHGHLKTLQWLRAQDPPCPWIETQVCTSAAGNGHLETLQWLRAHDPPCPWDAQVSEYAAYHGQLELLWWALTQDCPLNASCIIPDQFHHLEILWGERLSQFTPSPQWASADQWVIKPRGYI